MGSITASDPTQAGRLTTGVISNCSTQAACPGPINTLPRHYDSYSFINKSAVTECATIELQANGCGGTFMAAAAYLHSFDPANLCTNYRGQHNSTFNGTQSFAVTVPPGETMIVSVYEASPDTGCASYMLNVKSCGNIVPVTPSNGRIAFVSNRDGDTDIYVMDADGTDVTNLTNNSTASEDSPAWSPNGKKIAFSSNRDGNFEIYVMNADGSNQTRLTTNSAVDGAASWSPDGTRLVFHSNRDGNFEIYTMNADGSGQTRLTNIAGSDLAPGYSRDGSKIVFNTDRSGNTEVYIMNADGSGQTNLTNNAAADQLAVFSPDDTRIAFQTLRDGNIEVYLMDRDGMDPYNLTNNASADSAPAFSPDGSKIVFNSSRDGNFEIYVMDVDGSSPTRLTTDAGTDSSPDWSPATISCLPAVIHGDIGQGSPDYPSTSGNQTGRLSQTGVNSSCAVPKPTPGVIGTTARAYDAYTFPNDTDSAACVTFTFPASCGVNQAIHPVAYLGAFNPANVTTNYLGDYGSSINVSAGGTFSVNVPARAQVVLVVHEIGTVADCPNYTFTVSGLPCPLRITSITRPAPGHYTVQGLGVPNTIYSIEASTDLLTDPFDVLHGAVIADGAGLLRFEDGTAGAQTKRFYRFTYP